MTTSQKLYFRPLYNYDISNHENVTKATAYEIILCLRILITTASPAAKAAQKKAAAHENGTSKTGRNSANAVTSKPGSRKRNKTTTTGITRAEKCARKGKRRSACKLYSVGATLRNCICNATSWSCGNNAIGW